ncbi:SurA N-terminal domain-containing protein [Rhabdaerophilum sp. SD176]|uniref:SurA N-terminal domain-containing protein n=1 Tax=Rhabdaerophilum sp. SD176 TaxID=2983548 RepID=UPI0024DF54F0|nr:SurA N-terminal domain-containing protein [Rhabdaerophilum sp. SD176]
MLTAIRTASSKWLGRLVLTVIMGFLIVSFAIWGIGDIFRGGVNRTVAKVGSATINADEFRAAYNTELQRIQRQVRRVVTSEEARAFGLDRGLLNRQIDELALTEQARKLGLAVDQLTVMRSITEAPEFKTGGIFDRARLADALSQAGLSEQAFVQRQTDLLLRQQIFNGLAGGMAGAKALGKAVHQFRNEERNLDVILVPVDKVPAAAEPDEAALKAFFEERKAEFRTVETRKVSIIQVQPADFAASLVITEADLRAYYDRQVIAGRFGSPERRQAQRVLFDSEDEAKAAAAKLAGGMTFEALLAERKLSAADVDLGLKTAAELTDAALRDAVFKTAEGQLSAPVKDPFGFVLVRVLKVEPARVTPFEAVRGQIEGDARMDKLQSDPSIKAQVDGLFRKIEDQRIAGKSLAETAQAVGARLVTLAALDRQGNDGNGNRVPVPGGTETINAVFASDIGLDNEPLQGRDGGYTWYEVNAVEPARDKNFDEVKDQVRTRLLADRRDKALAEFMTGLFKRVEEGATLAAISQELGLPVQRFAGIRRNAREATLGASGVERAFAGPVGKPVSALAGDGTSRALIVPVDATLLAHDPAQDVASGLERQISTGLAEDLMAQYIAALRKSVGVSINQTVLNQALGQTN